MKNKELTIVIPCKNEEKHLPKLLDSLLVQTYSIKNVPIFIADAESTDNTRKLISEYKIKHRLNIKITKGGLPSVGRNSGAKKAKTEYILFIDSDIILSKRALEKSISLIKKRNFECVTINVFCKNLDIIANFLYLLNNLAQYLSKLTSPYSTGMFILIKRKTFQRLKGFNEQVNHAEDYFLTKQIPKNKFAVASSFLLTSNRRFKKMGYWNIIKLTFLSALNTKNDSFFYKDKGYWKEPVE